MSKSDVFTRLVGPTEGEWIADRYTDDFEIVVTQDGRAPWRLAGYIAREEDARVMAASKDLLAALKGVIRTADRETAEFHSAKAAIAKAEGR